MHPRIVNETRLYSMLSCETRILLGHLDKQCGLVTSLMVRERVHVNVNHLPHAKFWRRRVM